MFSTEIDGQATPHILVLGVGGTIAGLAPDPVNAVSYTAGQIEVSQLLEQIQGDISILPRIVSRQIANIDCKDLSEELLAQVGLTVQEALQETATLGVVITHGTDTIEETGFFLGATCGKIAEKLGKKVVLTGAMLPSNAKGADGPENLVSALRWAATNQKSCPGGIYAVFGGKVCMARDLAKRHTSSLNAPLVDSPTSSVDLIDPSWLSRLKSVQKSLKEDMPIPRGNWPWVEIVVSHAGSRPQLIKALIHEGVKGLVLAGTGMGGVHLSWVDSLRSANKLGIALVRASRTGAGSVINFNDGLSCQLADSLSAPKARIALQLALNAANKESDKSKSLTWQDFFARIVGLPEYR